MSIISDIRALKTMVTQEGTLILRLAKNDFRTRYAGSYLGIFWAFVQPVVTILVYWFVFSTLRSPHMRQVPFVLWLTAGLVPWFFFSEGLGSGCNALIEYSYLVKKVVFDIKVLPVVKLIAALFVHLFFMGILVILYLCMGYFPGITVIQIVYYTFCTFCLLWGISYLTCSVVIFFRDLTQIIGIILQIGVWLTPIMWNVEDMQMPAFLVIFFKSNPMYYIVEGYRDSLIGKVWFWEHPVLTAWFWGVTLVCFLLGTRVFRRLKVHFADVL